VPKLGTSRLYPATYGLSVYCGDLARCSLSYVTYHMSYETV